MIRLERWATLALLALSLFGTGCSKDVQIGALISETGGVALYGERVRRGLDLALEEINQAGGFQGGQFELIYRDDGTNKAKGLEAATELMDQLGVRFIIGAVSSEVTLAVAPLAEKNRVVMLSPSSSAPEVSDAGSYIFRNYPSDVLEGTSMADFARDLGLERVAIIAIDNAFGRGLRDVFVRGYESRNRQVVSTFDIPSDSAVAPDYGAIIAELAVSKPDGIYIVCYVEHQAELLRRLRESGQQAVMLSSASVIDDLVRLAGDAAENLVFAQPSFDLASTEPGVASFVKAYRAKYSEDPDLFAAHGYDALRLIFEAMKLTNSSHPEDVKRGLLSIDDYQGAAGRTDFDEKGDVVRYPRLFVIQQGRPVPYQVFTEQGGKLPLPAQG